MSSSQKTSGLQRLPLWILPAILAIPAAQLWVQVATSDWTKKFYHGLMHTSGEFAVRMLVVSLLATPILRAWPRSSIGKWLRRRRRTFGLAAFSYGVLHLTFYLMNETPGGILGDILSFFYASGWTALLLMLPLALTSTKGWQRKLRKRWFTLHKAAYFVVIAVAIHWMLKKGSPVNTQILIHLLPLLLLQANRWRLKWQERA